jgi:hypothetical protein
MLVVQWSFQSIKTLAVNPLSAMTSLVDKIVLSHQYNIFKWLENAYTAVCWWDEALTIEEGRLLGVEDIIKIVAGHQGKNMSDFNPGLKIKTI